MLNLEIPFRFPLLEFWDSVTQSASQSVYFLPGMIETVALHCAVNVISRSIMTACSTVLKATDKSRKLGQKSHHSWPLPLCQTWPWGWPSESNGGTRTQTCESPANFSELDNLPTWQAPSPLFSSRLKMTGRLQIIRKERGSLMFRTGFLRLYRSGMILGMTLNCLHRVIFLQNPGANDL